MFNTGRFNRVRFNVRAGGEEAVMLAGALHAAFHAALFTSINSYMESFAAAHMEAKSILSRGILAARTAGAEVRAASKGYSLLYAAGGGACGIMAAVTIEITTGALGTFGAEFAQRTWVSANSFAEGMARAEIGARSRMAKNVYWPPRTVAALFDGTVGVSKFNMAYATFDVAIPPGAKLVIDSAGYVVLLDGEDVIWAHEGDWLHLSRRTHDVLFQAAGELVIDKQILYTERWL